MTDPTLSPSTVDPSPEDDSPLCPACGYDLRGTPGERCSECGQVIDRASLQISGFPWPHRRKIGWVRAYLKTVWLVTINSRSLNYEASRPQMLEDARTFRYRTAGILAMMFVGAFAAAVIAPGGPTSMTIINALSMPPGRRVPGWLLDVLVPWSAGAAVPVTLPVCLVLLADHLTRAQKILFHRRGISPARRERLAAISYYAVSPLVWLLAVAIYGAVVTYLIVRDMVSYQQADRIVGAMWIMAAGAVFAAVVRTAQWVARVRHGGWMHGLLAAGLLLALWLFGLLVLLGIIPWCVGFVWIVIDSFR